MAGRKSKDKGKRGERELCSILTNIFGKPFIRVPNSGAFVGGKNVFRKNTIDKSQEKLMKGDIIPPEGLNHLVFECKNHKNIKTDTFITNNTKVNSWIDQCLEIVDEKDIWFVCFKIQNRGWYILVSNNFVDFSSLQSNYITYNYKEKKYIVCNMVEFFNSHKSTLSNPN